jgi:cytoskeletal protein RodZ
MKAMTITVIVIAALVLATGLWYTQTHMARPTPDTTPTPAPTPTAPPTTTPTAAPTPTTTSSATVTANLNQKGVEATPGTNDWVILINGTVTNDSPNTAYGVGLHVFSLADGALWPYEETVNVTVPVASGTYNATSTYGLSTIPPNQSVSINIEIIPPPALGEWRVTENATVTVVWSNTPT